MRDIGTMVRRLFPAHAGLNRNTGRCPAPSQPRVRHTLWRRRLLFRRSHSRTGRLFRQRTAGHRGRTSPRSCALHPSLVGRDESQPARRVCRRRQGARSRRLSRRLPDGARGTRRRVSDPNDRLDEHTARFARSRRPQTMTCPLHPRRRGVKGRMSSVFRTTTPVCAAPTARGYHGRIRLWQEAGKV
jgi:hypothetical protein